MQKRKLFEGDLGIDVRSARWTPDERYLVITGINSAGHSPWHFFVEIFSVTARQIREIDPSANPLVVSANMVFEPPNIVIFVGHTFAHGISAPDDPIPVLFNLDKLWPTLKEANQPMQPTAGRNTLELPKTHTSTPAATRVLASGG